MVNLEVVVWDLNICKRSKRRLEISYCKHNQEEKMESIDVILSLIGTALSMLVACLVFLIKLIHAMRVRKNKQDNDLLLEAVAPIMEIAETYLHYDGVEKKEYVMTKVNQFALENKITFNTEEISKKIEELIKFSKQVNAKKKAE